MFPILHGEGVVVPFSEGGALGHSPVSFIFAHLIKMTLFISFLLHGLEFDDS